MCFLIVQLRSHFMLSHSHIKSLEFTEHFRVEKGVLPYDEGLSVIFIGLPGSVTAFVSLFYLAFNIFPALAHGVGQRHEERQGIKRTLEHA